MADISDRFLRASDVSDKWGLNVVLFGPNGAGKTTLASTAQDSEFGRDVIFCDVEGGTRSIADREDIQVFVPDRWSEIADFYAFLAGQQHPYRTIVLDSLAELYHYAIKDVMGGASGAPQLQHYGEANDRLATLVRNFKRFSRELGWNVIFTAPAVEVKDDITGMVLTRVDLTPGAAKSVFQIVDTMAYLGVESKREGGTLQTRRYLQIGPTGNITAKHRQPRSGNPLPTRITDPSLVSILAQRKESK